MALHASWSHTKTLRWWLVAGIAIIALTALMPSAAMAERNCTANDNLDEVVDDFMARCTKGDIQRIFPGEMRGKTLREIKEGTSAAHKRAWKLVNRKIYLKSSVAPSVSPSDQDINYFSGTATWSVTVAQDPEYEETLVFDFGDGGRETRTVPQGSGEVTFTFSHLYEMEPEEWWGGGRTWSVVVRIAGGFLDGEPLPSGGGGGGTVHQC